MLFIAVTFNLSLPIFIIFCTPSPVESATLIVVSPVVAMSAESVVTDEDTAGVPPYDLSTYNSPAKPSGSIEPVFPVIDASSEYLFEPDMYTYSTLKPASLTDLILSISPSVNPEVLATENVTAFAAYDDDPAKITPSVSFKGCIVVALETINCPPTTLTVSFSNTVVLSVPLIRIFSNSAEPLPIVSILQPFKLETKLDDSSFPSECITKPVSFSP